MSSVRSRQLGPTLFPGVFRKLFVDLSEGITVIQESSGDVQKPILLGGLDVHLLINAWDNVVVSKGKVEFFFNLLNSHFTLTIIR